MIRTYSDFETADKMQKLYYKHTKIRLKQTNTLMTWNTGNTHYQYKIQTSGMTKHVQLATTSVQI